MSLVCDISLSATKRPDIFRYIDFRKYLKHIFNYYKEIYPYFSYRYISQKVNAGSAGWFPNITSGRNTLTEAFIFRTAKLFKLSKRELEYFELIIKYEQASSLEVKEYYLSRIHEMRGIESRILGENKLDYYRHWYIDTIRELLLICESDGNGDCLAALLSPPISENEATNAVKTLINLGLVRKNIHGILKPTDEIVRKDPEFVSIYWTANMQSKIKLALNALEKTPKDERDFSEVVVSLSASALLEVKTELALLREKILSISKKDTERDRVYQCSLQLFPLSKNIKQNQ